MSKNLEQKSQGFWDGFNRNLQAEFVSVNHLLDEYKQLAKNMPEIGKGLIYGDSEVSRRCIAGSLTGAIAHPLISVPATTIGITIYGIIDYFS